MYFPKTLTDDLLQFIGRTYGGIMRRHELRPPVQMIVAKGIIAGDVIWVRDDEGESENYELCCTNKERLNTIAGDWQAMLMIQMQQEDAE